MTRRAPVLALLAAILLAALFWWFVWRPLDAQQTALEDERAQAEQQQAQLRQQLAMLRDLAEREVEFRAELARLESFLPSGLNQPTVIRQMQLAGDASGVVIQSITFGDPEVVEGAPPAGRDNLVLTTVPVTMVLEGGYFQAVDFFRRVEVEIDRAILVRSFTMTEGTEATFPTLATTWGGAVFALLPAVEVAPTGGAGEGTPQAGGTPAPGATGTPAPGATATPGPGAGAATPTPTPVGGG